MCPEAIKLAPEVRSLRGRGVPTLLVATAQHREMLDQVLTLFALESDRDLDWMRPNQGLSGLAARALEGIGASPSGTSDAGVARIVALAVERWLAGGKPLLAEGEAFHPGEVVRV